MPSYQLAVDAKDHLTGEQGDKYPNIPEFMDMLRINNRDIRTYQNKADRVSRALGHHGDQTDVEEGVRLRDQAIRLVQEAEDSNKEMLGNVAVSEEQADEGRENQKRIAEKRDLDTIRAMIEERRGLY